MSKPDLNTMIFAGVAGRGYGKSIIAAEYARLMQKVGAVVIPSPYARRAMIIMDELPNPFLDLDLRLVCEFKDERFPHLTVQVREEELDKHDPRNRNPRAGRQRVWMITGAGEQKTLHNLNQAKFLAKTRHEKAVKQALQQRVA